MSARARRCAVMMATAVLATALAPMAPASAEEECRVDAGNDGGGGAAELVEVCLGLDTQAGTLDVRWVAQAPIDVAALPDGEVASLVLAGEAEHRGPDSVMAHEPLSLVAQEGVLELVLVGFGGPTKDPACRRPAVVDGSSVSVDGFPMSCLVPIELLDGQAVAPTCLVVLGEFRDDEHPGGSARPFQLGNWDRDATDDFGGPDEPSDLPDPDPTLVGDGQLDGDPVTTEIVPQGDPAFAAVATSRARFHQASDPVCGLVRNPARIVLARNDDFADALAGSRLLGDAPLLLTAPDALGPVTRREIERLRGGRGGQGFEVVLLGGTAAIGPAVEDALRQDGHDVVRVAGATRVETALAVAERSRRVECTEEDPVTGAPPQCSPVPFTRVLLARSSAPADNPTAAWADSVAAGSADPAVPILLTPSGELHPAVAEWLQREGTAETLLLGGEAALAAAVEGAVPGPRRLAGADRAGTAVAIAHAFAADPAAPLRKAVIVNGQAGDGWAYGLAAAGLALDSDLPILLSGRDAVPEATLQALTSCDTPSVDVLLVGNEAVIGPAARAQLDAVDGAPCAPRRGR